MRSKRFPSPVDEENPRQGLGYNVAAAKVAEFADAPDSGSGGRELVGVRVPPLAPAGINGLPENCNLYLRSRISGISHLSPTSFKLLLLSSLGLSHHLFRMTRHEVQIALGGLDAFMAQVTSVRL